MYVHIKAQATMHAYADTHTYMRTCKHILIKTCMHTHAHMYSRHTNIHVYTSTHIDMYIDT